MRKANETRNYSYLEGLIEEIQWAGNRMEAGLEDNRDIKLLREEKSKVKSSLVKIQEQLRKIKSDLGDKAPKSIDNIIKKNLKYF